MARCQSCVENKLRALLRQERERVKELEKIETVARQLTDGSHPCFVSNHEKCKHDRYGYEGCEQCYDEALLAALEGGEQDGGT